MSDEGLKQQIRLSITEHEAALKQLREELQNTPEGTDRWDELNDEIRETEYDLNVLRQQLD